MKINAEPQALPDHFNMEERSVVGQQKIKLNHLSSSNAMLVPPITVSSNA
jgi:hypothetical protein